MNVRSEPPPVTRRVDELAVRVLPDEERLARAAASHTARIIRAAVARSGRARVVFATGNSQIGFVAALASEDVPWPEVTVFHMDEYIGIGAEHPAGFRRWIHARIVEPYGPGAVHAIDGDAGDVHEECARYEGLLRSEAIDLVCMGIGENGHLAFNEPLAADLADRSWVRVVELDGRSRRQQVDEGHFPTTDDVPTHAISLTVPALLAADAVQVVVPEARKAAAVRSALEDPISNACPATSLRRCEHASLWLETASAQLWGR